MASLVFTLSHLQRYSCHTVSTLHPRHVTTCKLLHSILFDIFYAHLLKYRYFYTCCRINYNKQTFWLEESSYDSQRLYLVSIRSLYDAIPWATVKKESGPWKDWFQLLVGYYCFKSYQKHKNISAILCETRHHILLFQAWIVISYCFKKSYPFTNATITQQFTTLSSLFKKRLQHRNHPPMSRH